MNEPTQTHEWTLTYTRTNTHSSTCTNNKINASKNIHIYTKSTCIFAFKIRCLNTQAQMLTMLTVQLHSKRNIERKVREEGENERKRKRERECARVFVCVRERKKVDCGLFP